MKRAHLYALGVSLALVIWMLLGLVSKSTTAHDTKSSSDNASPQKQFTVKAVNLKSAWVSKHVFAHGEVSPSREIDIKAETKGRVRQIYHSEGSRVEKGQLILSLDMANRDLELIKAKAKVEEYQRKLKGQKDLSHRGFAAKSKIDEAKAALKTSEAELELIKRDIAYTKIRAPFAGILEKQQVEIGDFVDVGDVVSTLIDNTPLLVKVHVSQHDVDKLHLGDRAKIVLASGKRLTGRIQFISARADNRTRTYLVDIEVSNTDNIRSGGSASVYIDIGRVKGHRISSSMVSLDKKGLAGVKTLDKQNKVRFYPVAIIRSDMHHLWVTGLPDEVRVITIGHSFVNVGEKVSVLNEKKHHESHH